MISELSIDDNRFSVKQSVYMAAMHQSYPGT